MPIMRPHLEYILINNYIIQCELWNANKKEKRISLSMRRYYYIIQLEKMNSYHINTILQSFQIKVQKFIAYFIATVI